MLHHLVYVEKIFLFNYEVKDISIFIYRIFLRTFLKKNIVTLFASNLDLLIPR
jgi:hypothetical protein